MSDNSRKVLEVEGGFIAKEYNAEGGVVAQSAVVATAEEAEAAELVPLQKKVEEAPEAKDATLPSDKAGEESGAAKEEVATAPAEAAAGEEVKAPAEGEGATAPVDPAAPPAAPEGEQNQDGAKG